jgi:hypothetical protein
MSSPKIELTAADYHHLIYDEEQVKLACKLFLVGLQDHPDWVYMASLHSRDKYVKPEHPLYVKLHEAHLTNKCVNKVVISDDNPDVFLRMIRRFESRIGSYTTFQKKGDRHIELPSETLCVILTLNPASMKESFTQLSIEMLKDYSGQASRISNPRKIDSELRSLIHQNASTHSRVVRDIDIDTKQEDHLKLIRRHLFEGGDQLSSFESVIVAMIETTNGYHLVFDHKSFNRDQHKRYRALISDAQWKITELSRNGESVKKTLLCQNEGNGVPLPGTIAGGAFKIRFVDFRQVFQLSKSSSSPSAIVEKQDTKQKMKKVRVDKKLSINFCYDIDKVSCHQIGLLSPFIEFIQVFAPDANIDCIPEIYLKTEWRLEIIKQTGKNQSKEIFPFEHAWLSEEHGVERIHALLKTCNTWLNKPKFTHVLDDRLTSKLETHESKQEHDDDLP